MDSVFATIPTYSNAQGYPTMYRDSISLIWGNVDVEIHLHEA